MLRLYFENGKSSSGLNSNNISEADSLPIPGRKEYSCLGEVVEEFVSNWDHIMDTIDQVIKKNTLLYQEHSDTDHSDMDSHCDDFYAFDWGDGYTAYIYKYRVEMGIIVSLTKGFVLEDGGDDMTIGWIHPDNADEPQLAFFTRPFLECFSDSTKYGEDLFFSILSCNGYISKCSGEVRWLFSEGLAFGYKYCKFYVFNRFTDQIKYQGEDLTDDMKKELDNRLWNTGW